MPDSLPPSARAWHRISTSFDALPASSNNIAFATIIVACFSVVVCSQLVWRIRIKPSRVNRVAADEEEGGTDMREGAA